ncbi:MAG: class I SAM-dependent methyltransferase [Pseudomonadota bacterium]
MLKNLLVKARDARWVWDLFAPIYNHRIYDALFELYENIAEEITPDGPSQILDVGAGPGYITLLLAARHPTASLTGIDFSATQVRAAERLRKRRGIDNCRFELGNAMHLPFADDWFDAVVSVGSIKHWPDPQQGITEIYRVLAPGRWAVISETDREASGKALRRFMQRFTAWFFWDPLLFWGLRHIIFDHSFSQQEIVSFSQTARFREIRTEKLATCPYVIVKAQK